jgi:Pyruvate/2-oxoacid:ferredoxin oxidoreductase delta subunit
MWIKDRIRYKLQQFIINTQTLNLKNAPFLKRLLAFIYKLLGRKLIAKSMISSTHCKGCTLCAEVCPNHAVTFRLKNPYRNRRCKGCLVCAYRCPQRAVELPLASLAGAFLLIWLPYDEWIIKLFALDFFPDTASFGYLLFSFLLWCLGYVMVVFVFDKVMFLLSTLSVSKKIGKIPVVKKVRKYIHPGSIFPVLLPRYNQPVQNINTNLSVNRGKE